MFQNELEEPAQLFERRDTATVWNCEFACSEVACERSNGQPPIKGTELGDGTPIAGCQT